jgi:hypothetical protein
MNKEHVMQIRVLVARIIQSASVFALVAAIPLNAGSGDSKYRFGGQLALAVPTGNIKEQSKAGFGGSLFVERTMGKKFALRGRIEITTFGKNVDDINDLPTNEMFSEQGWKATADSRGLMLDCIYRLDTHTKGYFFFIGGGLLDTDISYKYWEHIPFYYGQFLGKSGYRAASAIAVGFGHNFNAHFGAEVKYTESYGGIQINNYGQDNYTDNNKDLKFNWIQLSFNYRF